MLNDEQKDALRKWYRKTDILAEAKDLIDREEYEPLEEFIQMRALFPLGRHTELPDYLLDDGKPLIPKNCDPRKDQDEWRDAIDVGWEVVEAELGLSRDQIHLAIKEQQEKSWETFLQSVDERKRERDQSAKK
ncbi:MAG: hypothetical protein ABI333_11260 [bacterium]